MTFFSAQYLNSFIKYICITFGLLGTGGFAFLAFNSSSSETSIDEEVIVERDTQLSSNMYPDEAEGKNPFEAISKAGSEFKDKIASRISF